MKCGFLGNFEVVDKIAFSILVANIETCSTDSVKNRKVGMALEEGKKEEALSDKFMCYWCRVSKELIAKKAQTEQDL